VRSALCVCVRVCVCVLWLLYVVPMQLMTYLNHTSHGIPDTVAMSVHTKKAKKGEGLTHSSLSSPPPPTPPTHPTAQLLRLVARVGNPIRHVPLLIPLL
jgi:hypothetical protein